MIRLLLLLLLGSSLAAQTPGRTFLLDFGPADGATEGTDDLGNRWNNIVDPFAGDVLFGLTTTEGVDAEFTVFVSRNFGIDDPTANDVTEPDTALLGPLAVASATADYFTSSNRSELTFEGLDPNSAYRFDLFGGAAFSSRRNTEYTLSGFTGDACEVQTSGPGLGGPAGLANDSVVCRSELVFPDGDGRIRLEVRVALGRTAYLNALQLTEFPGVEICPEENDLGIVVMGSSVARGQGAPNDRGYAFQYGQLLDQRADAGLGAEWELTNISVGGNNTVAVLDRWARDLVPLCDRYVVYGLSLANEGIRNRGQEAFDQFRDNMRELIRLARARDMVPVVVGNYSRRDFDAGDYAFIREMNLLIHQWDVASVNVLGTNDNGSGNWVAGFEADLGHPNLAGHTEFYHAFVPSLFDALAAGKPQPEYTEETFASVGSEVDGEPIVLTPEETVHSFTTTLSFRTGGSGDLLTFETADGAGRLSISDADRLSYASPGGEFLSAAPLVTDGNWHTVSLTHYWARGETLLYVDGERVSGAVSERLLPTQLSAAGSAAPPQLDLRNWLFHRSGMNAQEMDTLHAGVLLKSSLEVYAPLDGQGLLGDDPLINLAQSLNGLTNAFLDDLPPFAELPELRLYPNPVGDWLHLDPGGGPLPDSIELWDTNGRLLLRAVGTTRLSLAELPAGGYYVRFRSGDRWTKGRMIIRQ